MISTRRGFIGGAATLPFLARTARAQARPGHLRYGLSAFPPNLQPWVSTGATAGTVKMLTGRSLVSFDRTGKLQPELATSWSVDPDGTWTFRLRPGVVFHNGETVTADDVKWTIEQIAAANSTAYMRAQFQQVARIDIPDPLTVRLVMKSRQATLPTWFANYNMFIVWRKSAANDPIGCGPFVITGQERGTSIELAAFDRYFKPGLPKLKGITFITYADENLRIAALRSGDVDMIEYVPWQSMSAVESDPRLRLAAVDGAAFMVVLFNGTRPPFSNPLVRRAVAHAVKREDIVQAAFFGRGKALEGVPIIEGSPYYDDRLAHGWNYDPARSKALLAEAGYPNGFSTTMLATAQYSMHKDTAEVTQQYLAAIGIQAELRLPDWAGRVSAGIKGQYDMAIHGLAADNNDPDGLTAVMDTSAAPAQSRSFGLSAPRTVDALARGRAEFDEAKRIQIYREMQAAALEEVPLAGLSWRTQGFGMDRRVTGFSNLPGALSTTSGSTLEETTFL